MIEKFEIEKTTKSWKKGQFFLPLPN